MTDVGLLIASVVMLVIVASFVFIRHRRARGRAHAREVEVRSAERAILTRKLVEGVRRQREAVRNAQGDGRRDGAKS